MNKNPTILLVEDNPDDEALTLRALAQGKIRNEVFVVRDGQEALDYLFCEGAYEGRATGNPQCVLLDLKLPKVDGHEVLRMIRANEKTKLIPVVILTSSAEESDLVQGYTIGANSYVVKPVDMAQFTDAVQSLQLYWLVINESPVDAR